jgi:hypothetical protein
MTAARWTAAVALAVLTATTPAHAYLKFGVDVGGRTVPVRWPNGTIRYSVTERDISGVSAQAFSDAIGRATATWAKVSGLPVTFSDQGLTRSQPLDADGRSTIGLLDRPDQERVLGATTFLLDAATGALIESDIYFNTRFRWSTAAGGETGAVDLESVALHELGHLLGLGHSALGETEVTGTGRRVVSTAAIMFPIAWPAGSIADRRLQADDIAGIRDLYDALPATEYGSVQGRVTKDGRGVYGAHVVAASLETGALVASYTLSASGDFVIAGLPPGMYVVRAEPLDDVDLESVFGGAAVDLAFRPAYARRLAVVQAGGATPSLTIEVTAK